MLKNKLTALLLILIIIVVVALAFLSQMESKQAKMLNTFNLENKTIQEIVYDLESQTFDPSLSASITSKHLVLTNEDESVKIELPEDQFYVAFAPYIATTHPCTYHNLTTCQSELANQEFHVLIKEDNEVIIDEMMTSFDNGFIGVWLEKDKEFILEVTYNNLMAKTFIKTTDDSNTCITTPLQLK
mgnify:FL=1